MTSRSIPSLNLLTNDTPFFVPTNEKKIKLGMRTLLKCRFLQSRDRADNECGRSLRRNELGQNRLPPLRVVSTIFRVASNRPKNGSRTFFSTARRTPLDSLSTHATFTPRLHEVVIHFFNTISCDSRQKELL